MLRKSDTTPKFQQWRISTYQNIGAKPSKNMIILSDMERVGWQIYKCLDIFA